METDGAGKSESRSEGAGARESDRAAEVDRETAERVDAAMNGGKSAADEAEPTSDDLASAQGRLAEQGEVARQTFERVNKSGSREAFGPGAPETLEPSLRDQMLASADSPDDVARIDQFLETEAGIAAAEAYDFNYALENSGLTDDQKIQAMRDYTRGRDFVYGEDGTFVVDDAGQIAMEPLQYAEVSGATMTDAMPAGDQRSAAQVAADYAKAMNETIQGIADSGWAWAAGIAFEAVSFAAGGPVRYAIQTAVGEAIGEVSGHAVNFAADFIASRTGLTAEDSAHLAIAGGTILGAVAGASWREIRDSFRNLGRMVDDVTARITQRRRRDNPGPEASPNPTQQQLRAAEERGVDPRFIGEDGRLIYPDNNGFDGPPAIIELQPGQRFDRYGGYFDDDGVFRDGGGFVSPEGTPFSARSLPAGDETNRPFQSYEVVRPIPQVQSGPAAPWFDQPGGGTQHQLPMSIDDLVEQGFIVPVFE